MYLLILVQEVQSSPDLMFSTGNREAPFLSVPELEIKLNSGKSIPLMLILVSKRKRCLNSDLNIASDRSLLSQGVCMCLYVTSVCTRISTCLYMSVLV